MADTIVRSSPFLVRAFTDGTDTVKVRLYVNDAKTQEVLIAALLNGSVDFPFPTGLPLGTYTFKAAGVNAAGDEGVAATSNPLLVIGGKPSAITTIQVVLAV